MAFNNGHRDHIQRLQNFASLRLTRNNSSIARDSDIDDQDHRYTSLKDIILSSPPNSSSNNNQEGINHDFDSSNITISNHLVKRAASAYLQSAAILATRNQNQIMRFSEKLRDRTTLGSSSWNVYLANLVTACFSPICRLIAYLRSR
jgi:hypothetical protein